MDIPSIVAFITTTALASIGLSSSPNAIGVVGLLTVLLLHPQFFSGKATQLIMPWVASTIGATISHVGAASNALQGPSVLSIFLSIAISAVVSVVPMAAVYFDARAIGKRHRYNWFRLAGFAAFWASTWGIISVLTPVGRLLTWSPVTGLGPYTWVSSYLGPWGIDFIVGAWSVTLAEVIAIPLSRHAFLIRDPEDPRNVEHVTPYADNPGEPTPRDRLTLYHKSAFTLLLIALAVPGSWTQTIPNPTYTTTTTPFSLGCVLPQNHLPHRTPHPPALTDYITETRKMTGAKLVLWPESALKFDSEAHRNATFEEIADKVLKGHKGLHIGLGFEENVSESRNKRTSKRNGFALLVDDKIVLRYYKRNLVPSMLIFHLTVTRQKLTSLLQSQSRFRCFRLRKSR